MSRFLLVACLFVLSAGTASADFILVKININKLNFFPTPGAGFMGGVPGGGPGGFPGGGPGGIPGGGPGGFPGGGFGGMPPGGGGPGGFPGGGFGGMPPGGGGARGGGGEGGGQPGGEGGPMMPGPLEDPDAKWITTFIELKGKPAMVGGAPGMGMIFQADHKWGKKNWMSVSPMFPIIYGNHIHHDPFLKEFDTKLNAEKKAKVKNVENFLHIARFALSRGQLKDFHRAMKEAADTDAKNAVVKTYQKVQKELAKPFKDEDPMQADLIRELKEEKFDPYYSEQKHYCLYAQFFKTDKYTEALVKRRLALLEDTLETFYYWFAVQKVEAGQPAPMQPNLPKHRLIAVLANGKEEFLTRHEQWGAVPMVGDGFTPRRDNFIVFSAKARINDPIYTEFDKLINDRIQEANVYLAPMRMSLSREDLLSGKINEVKGAGNVALFIGAAQTSMIVAKTLEDHAERGTVSNEAIRQLLVASDMFPRNVQIPDWMVEGLSAFFETSPGSLYPTIGRPSWLHLVSFKHLTKGKQKEAPGILFNVVTDRYFRDARKLSAELNENRDNVEMKVAADEAWELARSTSWAFIYYLAQNNKMDKLFQYGSELSSLPRDMDLDDTVMQGSFARAFAMTETRNPRRIASVPLSNMAISWFNTLDQTNLDLLTAQSVLLEERAKRPTALKSEKGNPATEPKGNPKGKGGSTPPNPGENPLKMSDLFGTVWVGTETLSGGSGKDYTHKISLQFAASTNTLKMVAVGHETMQGVWSLSLAGNEISFSLSASGSFNYKGTISGNRIDGTGDGMVLVKEGDAKRTITWQVTKNGTQGGGVNPNPMPQPPPPMPMPEPPQPNPGAKGPNLVGSRWSGSETLKGFGKLSFQFGPGGSATMFDVQGVTPGTYQLNDNNITIQFPGDVVYTGTLNGKMMSGTATNGMDTWNWTIAAPNGGAPPFQPMPPQKQPFPKKKGPFGG